MSSFIHNLQASLRKYSAPLIQWYRSLAQREQIAVGTLAVVFVVFFGYWLLWAPLANNLITAKQNYVAHQQVYEWVYEHGALIRNSDKQTGTTLAVQDRNKDVLTIVNSTATQHRLVLRSFSPEGPNKLRFQSEQQEFTAVMQWLYQLDESYGIKVTAIDISAGNVVGTVNVRATLERDN